jgi:hypothetical protein
LIASVPFPVINLSINLTLRQLFAGVLILPG